MHDTFGLVLMVNHACNLRCDYCYTGAKFQRAMPIAIGCKAIDRAAALLRRGGVLELGFFGGEPLLEAQRIREFIAHAEAAAQPKAINLQLSLTTNGTQATGAAWEIMLRQDLDLAVSCDGIRRAHDKHRRGLDGRATSHAVLLTMQKLLEAGKEFRVVLVVRPDTLDALPEGIEFLLERGVRRFEPSRDLWARWSNADAPRLERAIARCARIWRAALPEISLSWFDEKAALLSKALMNGTARCGFGDGQIAVAPSGNLYPCERLIGEDSPANQMRLPGHVGVGADFLSMSRAAPRSAAECGVCEMQSLCGTTCRCSNCIRTGNVAEPDGLLCLLNQVCLRETARAARGPLVDFGPPLRTEGCHGEVVTA